MTASTSQKQLPSGSPSPLESVIDGLTHLLRPPSAASASDKTQDQSVTLGHFSGKLDNGKAPITLFLKLKNGKLIGTYMAPSGKKYDIQGSLTGQQTVVLQTVATDVHVEMAGMLTKDQFVGTLSNPKHNYVSAFSLKPSASAPVSTAKPVARQTSGGAEAGETAESVVTPHAQETDHEQPLDEGGKINTISAAEAKRIRKQRDWGAAIGSLDGVTAYYNDGDGEKNGVHAGSRHYAPDGYDYGLRWQCVEYVRRYFHDVHGIKFSTKGDAFSYFDESVQDGETNGTRSLKQFKNGGNTKPQHGDLVVMGPNAFSAVGHVAIIASVTEDSITVAQQNVGTNFLQTFSLVETEKDGKKVYTTGQDAKSFKIQGWLRK